MKTPKNAKQPTKGYTPNKAKRRPDGWKPSSVKKFNVARKK